MMEETYKKVLALDSSGLVASVAVVEGDGYNSNLLAEYTVNYKKTHSQTLLPMLDAIVKMTELDLKTIDAIAVRQDRVLLPDFELVRLQQKGWVLHWKNLW